LKDNCAPKEKEKEKEVAPPQKQKEPVGYIALHPGN
jgi:hypothetical protein